MRRMEEEGKKVEDDRAAQIAVENKGSQDTAAQWTKVSVNGQRKERKEGGTKTRQRNKGLRRDKACGGDASK